MKLTEKQAFKIIDKVMWWWNPSEGLTKEEISDFVMNHLIDLELGDK